MNSSLLKSVTMAEVTMEFPEEMMWKAEPMSPEQCAPDFLDIDRLLESSTCYDNKDYTTGDRAEIASKLLDDLEAYVKHEDQQFPDWFEEKTDLPIFDVLPQLVTSFEGDAVVGHHQLDKSMMKPVLTSLNYAHHQLEQQQQQQPLSPSSLPSPQPQQLQQLTSPQPVHIVASPLFVPVIENDTSQLLQEFEYVLNGHETLTPPDSPREDDFITLLQGMQPSELDALVASRVDDSLYTGPPDNNVGGSSPGCASARSSVCGGEESDSLHASDSSGEEWLPRAASSYSPSASDSPCEDPDWVPQSSSFSGGPVRNSETKKKKTAAGRAPYSRNGVGPDERKLRKKEQNKNAATRYRQKKKAEVEGILGEEKGLKTKNDELKLKLTDLQREIKYLKSLMRDVFRAKGYIK